MVATRSNRVRLKETNTKQVRGICILVLFVRPPLRIRPRGMLERLRTCTRFSHRVQRSIIKPQVSLAMFLSNTMITPSHGIRTSRPISVTTTRDVFLNQRISSNKVHHSTKVRRRMINHKIPTSITTITTSMPNIYPHYQPLTRPPMTFNVGSPIRNSITRQLRRHLLLATRISTRQSLQGQLFTTMRRRHKQLHVGSNCNPFILHTRGKEALRCTRHVTLNKDNNKRRHRCQRGGNLRRHRVSFDGGAVSSLSSARIVTTKV